MPGAYLWGWDATAKDWVKVLVNADGKLIIDPSEILEDTPTDGEVGKAPTSNWAYDHEHTPEAHQAKTKEFFVPTVIGTELYDPGVCGAGYRINAAADYAQIELYVPHDFSSIDEIVVVVMPWATATHRLNFGVFYGANDEAISQGTLSDQDKAMTTTEYFEYDISVPAAAIAALDHVAVRVTGDDTNTPNLSVVGVRLKYS